MSTRLDDTYPQGNPEAATCRHCNETRVSAGAGIVCPTCDGTALSIAQKNGRAS